MIPCKGVYQPATPEDSYRILIDRLWPRAIKKDSLIVDNWCKGISPSSLLRQWFHANPNCFNEFSLRY